MCGPFQAGGAFSGPVDVRGFTTAFEFRVGDVSSGQYGDGLTFVLQNAGPGAVGQAGGVLLTTSTMRGTLSLRATETATLVPS